jgi:hypothetical protein
VYEWVDNTAAPFVQHEYTVKVIDGDKQSLPSDAAFITPERGRGVAAVRPGW